MRKFELPTACAWFVILICVIVLSGWQFDVVILRRLLPWAPPTTPLTTVLLLSLSLALLCSSRIKTGQKFTNPVPCYFLTLAALFIAIWSGLQYVLNLRPGLELLLYGQQVQAQGGLFPGRPSPHTAATAILIGTAIGLSPQMYERSRRLGTILCLLGIMIPWVALFGYASLTNPFYAVDNAPKTGMSPLTALAFITLAIGVISLHPKDGLAALFTADTSAGRIVRRILPVVILAPLCFGWIIIYGRESGMFDAPFGIALSWGVTSLLFAGLLLWQSQNLHEVDQERQWAFDEHEQLIKVMEKEKEKFRNLLELAPDAMVIADEQGIITMVNVQTSKLFGYERGELIGVPVEKLIPDRFRPGHPAHRKKYHDAPHARPMGSGMELFGLTKTGQEIPVEVSLNTLTTDEGRFVLAAIRDVTLQKQAAEQIKQSNATLKEQAEALEKSNMELQHFAYVVSHDLQTPLRSISGFVQLLQQTYEGKLDEQADGWIRRTVQNTQRMQTLIHDVLAYSRIEARSNPFTSVALNDVVNEVRDVLSDSIREAGAVIEVDELPAVMGDRPQLIQLMQNLVGNGLKYRRDEAVRVKISVRAEKDHWVISVRDNGIGIAPEHFQRIFDVFQRLHTQKTYPGTGIGLAICRRVVNRHGGNIWVESEPGKGSCFFFTIPKTEVTKL